MFDVRPGDGFGIFTVISDYYGYSRIVTSHAVDKILKLIITQESLRSYGNKGTDIVLCGEGRSNNRYLLFFFLLANNEMYKISGILFSV